MCSFAPFCNLKTPPSCIFTPVDKLNIYGNGKFIEKDSICEKGWRQMQLFIRSKFFKVCDLVRCWWEGWCQLITCKECSPSLRLVAGSVPQYPLDLNNGIWIQCSPSHRGCWHCFYSDSLRGEPLTAVQDIHPMLGVTRSSAEIGSNSSVLILYYDEWKELNRKIIPGKYCVKIIRRDSLIEFLISTQKEANYDLCNWQWSSGMR